MKVGFIIGRLFRDSLFLPKISAPHATKSINEPDFVSVSISLKQTVPLQIFTGINREQRIPAVFNFLDREQQKPVTQTVNLGTGDNTTVTPIPEGPNKDTWLILIRLPKGSMLQSEIKKAVLQEPSLTVPRNPG